ncbi:PAS-domain containing protein [Pseudorhodoplanes sp.]|uniref:PAS-domain containing protein n=1 Tax=Pseudorhodoplanes sp. TaxID=1934341 RepID=UPI002CD0676D|nr:PAS-domain containing protein [Pseudorhodoplanes sp.]HWV40787.1 PAS-domain containing protein [Pseudorhodoplanes sp.]
MFGALAPFNGDYNWRLVALAAIVCLLSSLVAISLFHRARATRARARSAWLVLAGAASGCGIWATHFIAMIAYLPGIAVIYDAELTAASFAIATLVTSLGLCIAVGGQGRFAAPLGGAIIGAGVAAIHYVSIWALQMPVNVTWTVSLIPASILLAVLLGAFALAVAVRNPGPGGTVAAAMLLTLAIMSHNHAAMAAALIVSDPMLVLPDHGISLTTLALAVAAGAVAILGMSLVGAAADVLVSKRKRQFARERQALLADSEEQLRQQNIRLDAALNNMTQGLCMFNAKEEIVVLNRRYLEMYKLSPQVVKPGCTLRQLIQHRKDVGLLDPDPQEYYQRIQGELRQGSVSTWLIRTTEGRLIQACNQPMPGGGWVTTHEDVTERRLAEEQVLEQKLQIDTALNNITQGLLMFSSDARLILCNRRYLELYGLSPDIVKPGLPLRDLLVMRRDTGTFMLDADSYIVKLRAAMANGKPITLTIELADGRIISVENHPMADGRWISTHEDITERRLAERRLHEQKLQLDTALNNMSQGLNMFDAAGRLVVCSERYLQMYNLSPDIVKPGCTVRELIDARIASGTFFSIDPKRYAEELLEAMNRREPTLTTMELTDGRTIEVIGHPTPDGSGWVVTHEDITERRRAERERDRSRAFADTVIENVPATIVVKDAATLRYVLVNKAGEEYYGLPRGEMIGKRTDEVFSKQEADTIFTHDKELLETKQPRFYDERPLKTPNGEHRIATTTRIPILDAQGEPQYLLTVIDDRTGRKRAEAEIARLVHHDMLTGLPNRAAFTACIDATIESMSREGHSFALMSLDFDRFKEVNDVYGHAAGDEFLRQTAKRLQAVAGGAFVARLGGDEFVVIATDGEQPAAAEALADRLLATVGEEFAINGQTLRASVSIGIALFPADASDAATLLGNADAALYRAKSEGRSAIRFFEAGMDKRLRERRVLQQELRSAVERGELTMHYQPQARISGDVFGFEALVRWQHPQRGMIPPDVFIPLAEESGLIIAMGEWIMREACREAASWPNPLQVAINLSPVQFRHGDLPGIVNTVLQETGLPPARLEFEITEGVLIDDFARAVAILRRLKALGVRIAMDDFGTGYSSLSYLQSFPFDKIKIDQAFISNLERNPQSATIVRAVIGLARGLELPVLAEGVETKEQRAFLARESCDEIQGYLIGRPSPIEDYAALVGRPRKIVRIRAVVT